VEEEHYMMRSVGTESWVQEGGYEPVAPRDVLTPVMESMPVELREKGKAEYWSHNLKFRPLIAPKKKWVEPEKKSEEGGDISRKSESSCSQRSVTTERSDKKRPERGDDCPQVERRVLQGPPRRYGYSARSTRVRVNIDREEGVQDISPVGDDNTEMTGGKGDGVRVVSARFWLEGGEVG